MFQCNSKIHLFAYRLNWLNRQRAKPMSESADQVLSSSVGQDAAAAHIANYGHIQAIG